MIIKLLIEGGDMKPGPAIAQQLGPLGVNIGKVISKVNESTRSFKGMKVPVELDINEKTKDFIIKTFSPPTAELLKNELKLEKGSAKISEVKVGNIAIEDVIKVAQIKKGNMLEKDMKAAVKSVLGTCASVGIMVENKNANELISEVNEWKYNKEISAEKNEPTSEKRAALNKYFNDLKSAQEAKAAAAAAAAQATEAAKTEAEAKPGEKTPATAAKTATAKAPAKADAAKTPAAKTPAAKTPAAKAPAAKAAAKPAAKAEKKK